MLAFAFRLLSSPALSLRLPPTNLRFQPGVGSIRRYAGMDDDAFYVVRKGDVVGVFGSLGDCQNQVSDSVCDPPVSVYKGYGLKKEAEEYLASQGLKNALYSIKAVDCKEDLFGTLVPCPFQQPDEQTSFGEIVPQKALSGEKILQKATSGEKVRQKASTEVSQKSSSKKRSRAAGGSDKLLSCVLEFDGASKGNPGKAGAGVVVRNEDGSVVSRLREGLGVATNNVAEYRALILGMKYALKKGFKNVAAQGDSRLVCMQVQNLWKTKHENLAELCKEAKELKNQFLSFQISHVKREFNSDADAEANFAITLPSGEVFEKE